MNSDEAITWPSGDCMPVIATLIKPEELISHLNIQVFRNRDDLDWFTGAKFYCEGVGPVLLTRHDNNPKKLTAIYVDAGCNISRAEKMVISALLLDEADVVWRRTSVDGLSK